MATDRTSFWAQSCIIFLLTITACPASKGFRVFRFPSVRSLGKLNGSYMHTLEGYALAISIIVQILLFSKGFDRVIMLYTSAFVPWTANTCPFCSDLASQFNGPRVAKTL